MQFVVSTNDTFYRFEKGKFQHCTFEKVSTIKKECRFPLQTCTFLAKYF